MWYLNTNCGKKCKIYALKWLEIKLYLQNFYSVFEKIMQTFFCSLFLNAKFITITFMLDKIDLGKYNKTKYCQTNV